jgi:hypothetical protein
VILLEDVERGLPGIGVPSIRMVGIATLRRRLLGQVANQLLVESIDIRLSVLPLAGRMGRVRLDMALGLGKHLGLVLLCCRVSIGVRLELGKIFSRMLAQLGRLGRVVVGSGGLGEQGLFVLARLRAIEKIEQVRPRIGRRGAVAEGIGRLGSLLRQWVLRRRLVMMLLGSGSWRLGVVGTSHQCSEQSLGISRSGGRLVDARGELCLWDAGLLRVVMMRWLVGLKRLGLRRLVLLVGLLLVVLRR